MPKEQDPEANQRQIALAVRSMRENLPAMLEMVVLEAQLQRARYVALLANGFEKSEALTLLCKKGEL